MLHFLYLIDFLKNGLVDTSLERRGGPWTLAANFSCEVEQFPFIGDFGR